MTREEARKAAEVMLAYANGEEIEVVCKDGTGIPNEDPTFNWFAAAYRVKPKPAYRPFKNKEECLQEMLKHQPFGWATDSEVYGIISTFSNTHIWFNGISTDYYTFEEAFDNLKFSDGTPFGIKEE